MRCFRIASLLPSVVLVLAASASGCKSFEEPRGAGESCTEDAGCASHSCAGGYCSGGACDVGQCDAGWTCVVYSGILSSSDSCERPCESDGDCPSTWGCTSGFCSYPRPLEFELSGPLQGATGEELEFTTEVKRSVGTASYVWDVARSVDEETPSWQTAGSSGSTLLHAFDEPASWLVRVRVSDGVPRDEWEGEKRWRLAIQSGAGQVCRVEDGGYSQEPNCGEGLTCYGESSSGPLCYPPLGVSIVYELDGWKIPAGDSMRFEAEWSKADPEPAITFSWFLDAEPIGEGAVLAHTFEDPGARQLRLEAQDEVGRSAESSADLTICATDGMTCDDTTICCGTNSWCRLGDAEPTCY